MPEGHIPESDAAVVAARNEKLAIGREGDAVDIVPVTETDRSEARQCPRWKRVTMSIETGNWRFPASHRRLGPFGSGRQGEDQDKEPTEDSGTHGHYEGPHFSTRQPNGRLGQTASRCRIVGE
jgi:hypothetical protein